MKWILIISLISVIMLIAYSVSEQYRDKADFYNNLKLFLSQLRLNVSFKQDKILDFLDKTKCKKYFSLFIEDYKVYLKTNKISFDNIKILDDDERSELVEIIKSLGKHDVKNELGQIGAFINNIDIKLNKAEEDKKKLCPMIIKLSLLFAIGLAILLI